MRLVPAILPALLLVLVVPAAEAAADDRPNVLFIAVDDLNDWVGCLDGQPDSRTLHIAGSACRGVAFERV